MSVFSMVLQTPATCSGCPVKWAGRFAVPTLSLCHCNGRVLTALPNCRGAALQGLSITSWSCPQRSGSPAPPTHISLGLGRGRGLFKATGWLGAETGPALAPELSAGGWLPTAVSLPSPWTPPLPAGSDLPPLGCSQGLGAAAKEACCRGCL